MVACEPHGLPASAPQALSAAVVGQDPRPRAGRTAARHHHAPHAGWRLDLRTGEFMDREPDPDGVPAALLAVIRKRWKFLCATWDEIYLENPVKSEEDHADE